MAFHGVMKLCGQLSELASMQEWSSLLRCGRPAPMVTTMLQCQGRQFGVSTAPCDNGFVSCWLCLVCGAEEDVPNCAVTREEAREAAEMIALGHVCVQSTAAR